jgi:hypothetical protein
MANRVFKWMGLNGKAVLPMMLGLGCDTMATLTTRILETRKERLIVILLLALGVPCSAQLTVVLAMLGSLSLTATAIWLGIVIGVILLVGAAAARVLPGYDPNVKIRLLQELKDKIDIVLCIYAGDIERGRVRGDFGITYDSATLKLIDDLRRWGLDILSVVITRFANQSSAVIFKIKLERRGVKGYLHYPIRSEERRVGKEC